MKHVFFIHSHITWLVSRGVIHLHGLARTDVLFVSSRGYEPPNAEYERLDFPDRGWLLTWRIDRWLRLRRELGRFVDQVAQNGDFLWYLPHTALPFFAAFVGHPRCCGFHLIEEGLASYFTREALVEHMQRTLSCAPGRVGRMLARLRPPEPADPRYLVAYGCTDEAFPGYARRTTVEIGGQLPTGDHDVNTVLVLDNALEVGLVDEQAFFKCFEEVVTKLAQVGHRSVHFKLHPGQYIDRRYTSRIQRVLQDNPYGVLFKELPANYCLELLAATSRPDFYVFVSSVGFYAAVSGCRVYSMASRLATLDARYKTIFLDPMPEVVRRRINFL